MIDQIMARQNKAIMSLIKLQGYGIIDNEIINVHEFLIQARLFLCHLIELKFAASKIRASISLFLRSQ